MAERADYDEVVLPARLGLLSPVSTRIFRSLRSTMPSAS